MAVGASIGTRVWNVENARQQSAEAFPLYSLGSGERERAKGASMKTSIEGNQLLAPGVIAGQLNRRFDRFGARIAEVHFLRLFSGRDGRKAFGQIHRIGHVKIRAGDVNEFSGLFLNRLDNSRMAM